MAAAVPTATAAALPTIKGVEAYQTVAEAAPKEPILIATPPYIMMKANLAAAMGTGDRAESSLATAVDCFSPTSSSRPVSPATATWPWTTSS